MAAVSPMEAIGNGYTEARMVGLFIEWRDTESVLKPDLRSSDLWLRGRGRVCVREPMSEGLSVRSRVWGAVLCCGSALSLAQGVPAPHRIERPGVEVPGGGSRRLENVTKTAVFEVPGGPDWSVVTENAVWVSVSRPGRVVQLDATSNKVGVTAEVKQPCSGLAAGFGSIWVPSCGDGAVVRLDPKTGKETGRVAAAPMNSEGGITVGAGSVWMVAKPGRLLRIDPATNAEVGGVDVPPGAENVAFGDGAVWVTSFAEGRLLRVDPASMKVVSSVAVGPQPRFLTVGAGAVWTLNQGDGTVTRVEMASGKVVATVPCGIPGPGGEISFGEGGVWATVYDVPLTEVDPATNRVRRQWKGAGGDGIRAGLGSVWLSNGRQGTVWRVDAGR